MRLPNGYGSVYKLSGNRRRPWIARKTIGWNSEGKQLYHTIGYFETKKAALIALAEFNQNPYDVESQNITFAEIYKKFSDIRFDNISKSSINVYRASFALCEPLHGMKFVEIKTHHMQTIISNCNKSHSTKQKIKSLCSQLFKYAMENDIVSKDYAQFLDIGKDTEGNKRKIFTEAEIRRLFEVVNDIDYVDTILIMIYSGLRIGELLTLECKNVDLEKRIMVGGIKTDAGKDRIIPISNKIIRFIENRIGGKYLIENEKGKPLKYKNYYRDKFTPIMVQLNMSHTPHDCRHTFATLMGNVGADTVALQKIIGHANYATTASIYTHKDEEQLRRAIDLL